MKFFNNLKITEKIFTVILIIAIGMIWFSYYSLTTLSNLKVNGPVYNKIVLEKDLVADILPPPSYLIESYLTVREMVDEKDSITLNQEAKYLVNKLRKEYFERHAYWIKNMPDGAMKNEMINLSYNPAKDFYSIVDNDFIPAIKRGDKQHARELADGILKEKYLEHRRHIDNVVLMANDYCKKTENTAKKETSNSIFMLVLIGITAIVSGVFVFAFVMSRKIITPLKKLQRASEQVGEGNYNISLPVLSKDEIGFLTETFNKMTLKIEKQRKEIEKEKTRRLSSLIDGQEIERQRISRELHDGVGQFLIAIKLKLENIINTQETCKESLIDVQQMFDTTIDEIRKISDNLMPSILKELGLVTALRNLCKMMAHASDINILFESEPLMKKFDERISTYLYRISQEALNNVVKHSVATEVNIKLIELQDHLELVLEDNGKGFDFSQDFRSKGNGIYNMRERVSILGGTFDLNTDKNSGTKITVKIPLYD